MFKFWVILAVLLIIRGVMVAIEVALQSISDPRARELAKENIRGSARLVRVKADPEATAAALRLGMVLAGFTAAAIGAQVPMALFSQTIEDVEASKWVASIGTALFLALFATLVDVSGLIIYFKVAQVILEGSLL